MTTAPHLGRCLTVVAAGSLLFASCSTTDCAAESDHARATAEPSYVALLDDDTRPDQVRGEPGTYAFTARGADTPPLAVIDVPAGYSNFGFFAVWPGERSTEPFRAVQYWTVHGVFRDPCHRSGSAPESGTSVEDLASALGAQRRSVVSDPEAISLDGHDGLYLELRVPSEIDLDRCADGYYMFWEGKPGDAPHTAASPGSVERVWLLDVDGHRVALAAIAEPGVPLAQRRELTAMIKSVRFVEPD